MKPLSTADFGKVMKQIFPSIRPRRLGTRGNSRYCYAAMRKTTKLECPQLPNLNEAKTSTITSAGRALTGGDVANNDADNEHDANDAGSPGSWKVIKMWAESLLNADFKSVDKLADHISTNYMNEASTTISNSSRVLLQKKLLQRKVKGRKKKAVLTNDVSKTHFQIENCEIVHYKVIKYNISTIYLHFLSFFCFLLVL